MASSSASDLSLYPTTSSASDETISNIITYFPDRIGRTEGIDFEMSSGDDVPRNAVKLGPSPCGETYVGGIKYMGTTMPCKIIPKNGASYFFYGGQHVTLPFCAYLVTEPGFSCEWVPSSEGDVSPETVRFGMDLACVENNESFAIGRVTIDEERCVGSIIPSRKLCFVAKDGKELRIKFYDSLVVKPYPDIYGLYSGVSIYQSQGSNDIPENAIEAGIAPCGKIYVGFVEIGNRRYHYTQQWEAMPAKINPAYHKAYYSHMNKECETDKHTFLVVNPGYKYKWVPDSNGYTPKNAVRLGRKFNGENFYVGRIRISGEPCVGKISTSSGCCMATYGGKSYLELNYDVLVVTKQEENGLGNSSGNEGPHPMVVESANALGEPQETQDPSGHFPDREGLTCGSEFYITKDANDIPENAIKLGVSPIGEAYVGAVKYHGATVPCKIIPEKKCCFFLYGGEEVSLPFYAYVVTKFGFSYEWIASSEESDIPSDAVKLCSDSSAVEKEYFAVGRVTLNEERSVGEIVSSNRLCFALNGGNYYWTKYYDVLTVKPNPDMYGFYKGVSVYHSKGLNEIPKNAIETGESSSGKNCVGFVEIGDRNFHYVRGWESMPANIKSADGLAYYSYYGVEYSTDKLVYLVIEPGYTYAWEPYIHSFNGRLPPNAVRLGRKFNGENFYVGRVTVGSEKCVGKISTPYTCCFSPFTGSEPMKYNFDVLVVSKENDANLPPLPAPPFPEMVSLPPQSAGPSFFHQSFILPLPSMSLPNLSVHNISIPNFGQYGLDNYMGPGFNPGDPNVVLDEDMTDDDAEYDIEIEFGGGGYGPETSAPKNWTRKPFIVNETVNLSQRFTEQQLVNLAECLSLNEGEKMAEEDESRTCVVCKINVPTRIIVPCGHDGLCRRCVELLIKEPSPRSYGADVRNKKPVLCPVCQSLVHTFTVRFKV